MGLELVCLFLDPLLWAKCCTRIELGVLDQQISFGNLQMGSHSLVTVVLKEVCVK